MGENSMTAVHLVLMNDCKAACVAVESSKVAAQSDLGEHCLRAHRHNDPAHTYIDLRTESLFELIAFSIPAIRGTPDLPLLLIENCWSRAGEILQF